MGQWRSRRQECAHLAEVMRAEGRTWVEIADDFRARYRVNARKALRWAHGWTQADVAREWNSRWPDEAKTEQNVSTWETWPISGHEPSLRTLGRLAEIFECDLADLVVDIGCYRHLDSARHAPRPLAQARSYSDPRPESHVLWEPPVDRREFVAGAVAAAAVGGASGGRIGAADVARLRAGVRNLYALDDQFGGGVVYERALGQLRSVRGLLDTADYGPTVGRDLQVVTSRLCEMVGWLAFDLGKQDTARRFFTEALSTAQITGDGPSAVLAMASLSLQASTIGNGREARDLTQAAQRLAQSFGGPRLLSLLVAREALSHARLGDGHACATALVRSEQMLDEPYGDDEDWLGFWGFADFSWTTAAAQLALGEVGQAETASRAALESLDPTYRRNVALYKAGLAAALTAQGKLDEAAAIGSHALGVLDGDVSSGRTMAQLRSIRPHLERRTQAPAVRTYLDSLNALHD